MKKFYLKKSKKLKIKNNIILEIINKPFVNLSGIKEKVANDILSFVRESWGEYEEDRIKKYFLNLDTIIIGWSNNDICCISGGKWECLIYKDKHIKFYHIGLTVVKKSNKNTFVFRSNYLMSRISAILLKRELLKRFGKSYYVVLRTYNSKVYGAVVSYLSRVLPDYKGINIPNELERKIAREGAKIISPKCFFDDKNFIIIGAFKNNPDLVTNEINYGSRHYNTAIVSFFDKKINYKRGDAFIIVARVNLLSYFKYFLISKYKRFRNIIFVK